jgi:acyl carrier protein
MSGTRGEIFHIIRARLAEKLGVNPEDVTLNANFKGDLDADSLDLVEAIMDFEDDFGVKIDDEEAKKLTTVDETIRFVLDDKIINYSNNSR